MWILLVSLASKSPPRSPACRKYFLRCLQAESWGSPRNVSIPTTKDLLFHNACWIIISEFWLLLPIGQSPLLCAFATLIISSNHCSISHFIFLNCKLAYIAHLWDMIRLSRTINFGRCLMLKSVSMNSDAYTLSEKLYHPWSEKRIN